MRQKVGTCLCGIAGIVVTHLLIAIVIETTTSITIVFVLFVEEVIDGATYGDLLYSRQCKRIAQV